MYRNMGQFQQFKGKTPLKPEQIFSYVLLVPPVCFSIAAWLGWILRDGRATAQSREWRRIATKIALASATTNATLSAGYLLYKLFSPEVSFFVFDRCSTIGALCCLVAIVGAAAGKGAVTRMFAAFGGLSGVLFWYLTISPAS
jgi:hypothetical protein